MKIDFQNGTNHEHILVEFIIAKKLSNQIYESESTNQLIQINNSINDIVLI
jgi:hypothetical protein